MIHRSRSIRDIRLAFRRKLETEYDEREIQALTDLVIEETTGFSKIEIRTHPEREIPPHMGSAINRILEGLVEGKPVQYLLGKTEFYGLSLKVNSSVLIPRPETEELVRCVLNECTLPGLRVIDLGTGSGCIAIALAKHLTGPRVYAVDSSVAALNTAKENADAIGADVDFFLFDLLENESLGFMQFDVMVSNPPYVARSEGLQMDRRVVDHEPHAALFVPEDEPLIFYRKIVDLADGHLVRDGKLFFEINERFGEEIRSLLMDRGYAEVELRKDLNGKPRIIKAVKV
jgi:release factor glutamine methyltransferase